MIYIAGCNNLQFPSGIQGPPGPAGTGTQGEKGDTVDIIVNPDVTLLPYGESPTVETTVTDAGLTKTIKFSIPEGPQGDPGDPGGSTGTTDSSYSPYIGNTNTILKDAVKAVSLAKIENIQALYYINRVAAGMLLENGKYYYTVEISRSNYVGNTGEPVSSDPKIVKWSLESPVLLTGWLKHILAGYEDLTYKGSIVIDWDQLDVGGNYLNDRYKKGALYGIHTPPDYGATGGGGGDITTEKIIYITEENTIYGDSPVQYINPPNDDLVVSIAPMNQFNKTTVLKNVSSEFSFTVQCVSDGITIDGQASIVIGPKQFITIIPNEDCFEAYGNYLIDQG